MATPLDYKPRHKKPHAFAGSTPRGPERWARAMHNAWRHPNGEDAALFHRRLQTTLQVKNQHLPEVTFAFLKFQRTSGWREPLEGMWKVDYYCCSIHCASMNVLLDFPVDARYATSVVDVLKGVTQTSWNKVEAGRTPTRQVRCQFCGSTVQP